MLHFRDPTALTAPTTCARSHSLSLVEMQIVGPRAAPRDQQQQ